MYFLRKLMLHCPIEHVSTNIGYRKSSPFFALSESVTLEILLALLLRMYTMALLQNSELLDVFPQKTDAALMTYRACFFLYRVP